MSCCFNSPLLLIFKSDSNPGPQHKIPAQDDPLNENFAPNDPQTAIFTHDEYGDEIPAQNDITSENRTQNDTNSTGTLTQLQISDAETTYDDCTQETQQWPRTQPNLAIVPPNLPKTSTSHAETLSNWPPTAKFASGHLKRISPAVSSIPTPKKNKITSQSGYHHWLEPSSSNFDNLFDDDQKYTYQNVHTPEFEPQPTKNLSRPRYQDNENNQHLPNPAKITNLENNTQNQPQPQKLSEARLTSRQATHVTSSYPPTVETFFDKDTTHDSDQEPKSIQHTSHDALTSSTWTDFTYSPVEDLTKTLLKYAKNASLYKLAYPSNWPPRMPSPFQHFIDNLRILQNFFVDAPSLDLWPKQVSYSHPFIGFAIYNLISQTSAIPAKNILLMEHPTPKPQSKLSDVIAPR